MQELFHHRTQGENQAAGAAATGIGEQWRSWRLIEAERLTELQVVAINHAPQERSTTVRVHAAGGGEPVLFEQTLSFPARGLHRVQVPREQVASGCTPATRRSGSASIRCSPATASRTC